MAKHQKHAGQTPIPMHPFVMELAIQHFGHAFAEFMDAEELRHKQFMMLPDGMAVGEGSPLHKLFGEVSQSDLAQRLQQRAMVIVNMFRAFGLFEDSRDIIKTVNDVSAQEVSKQRMAGLPKAHWQETKELLSARYVEAPCPDEAAWAEQTQAARQFVRNILTASTRFRKPDDYDQLPDYYKAEMDKVGDVVVELQKHLIAHYDATPVLAFKDVVSNDPTAFGN